MSLSQSSNLLALLAILKSLISLSHSSNLLALLAIPKPLTFRTHSPNVLDHLAMFKLCLKHKSLDQNHYLLHITIFSKSA